MLPVWGNSLSGQGVGNGVGALDHHGYDTSNYSADFLENWRQSNQTRITEATPETMKAQLHSYGRSGAFASRRHAIQV
jgi:hypothetical protein